MDNKFDDYSNAPCYSGQPCPTGSQDLSGTPFSASPWEGHFGLDYTTPLGGSFQIGLTGDVGTFAKTPEINRQPATATAAHTILNGGIRIAQAGGPWEFPLVGTNLTDEFYASNIFGKPLNKAQDIIGVANQGREIRLQVHYKFASSKTR